jgi:hypothetical protein
VATGVQPLAACVIVLGCGPPPLPSSLELGERLARCGRQELALARRVDGGGAGDLGGLLERDPPRLQRLTGGGEPVELVGEVELVAGLPGGHAELAGGPLGAPGVASGAHHPGVGHPLGEAELLGREDALHGHDLAQHFARRRCAQHGRVERGEPRLERRTQGANVLQRRRLGGSIQHVFETTKGVGQSALGGRERDRSAHGAHRRWSANISRDRLSRSGHTERLHGDERKPRPRRSTVKYMLLIHQGTTPTPLDPEAWATLSAEEQQEIYAAYKAINETPGVTPGNGLQPPESATTVQVDNGQVLATDGPFVDVKEALNGFLTYECNDLDDAIALAATIPAARLGGAVEVRPVMEW